MPNDKVDGFINDLELAWNADTNSFALEVYVGSAFKWAHLRGYLASVFSGSNDRDNTPQLATITSYLRKVTEEHPVTLVSVIGGAFFLELVTAVDFKRIVLCDQNVAEFAKVCALCNLLNEDPTKDPYPELEREILSSAKTFMPMLKGSDLSVRLGPDSNWDFEGRSEPGYPVMLRGSNFPEYAWKTTQEDRVRTLSRLRSALVKSVFLSLPRIDAQGHLVVVNCSNADRRELTDELVRSHITGAAGVVIVRSDVNENLSALDPHPFWEAIARSLCVGRSHQMWPEEDHFCLGTKLDETTDTSSIMEVGDLPAETETLLCHILAGKCRGKMSNRYALIRRTMRQLPAHILRVVVAEFRPEGPAGRRVEGGFLQDSDCTNFYAGALSRFELVKTVYAPGADDTKRNMFLLFERRAEADRNESTAVEFDKHWAKRLGIERQYFIDESGFYPSEAFDGATLRWTTGAAELIIPPAEEAVFDTLNLQLWPMHPNGHRFTITINAEEIRQGTIDGSLGYSGTVTFPRCKVNRIEIQSDVIVYPRDERSLGLALRNFELSDSGS